MENYLKKIKYIIPTFILVTIFTVLLVLLFRWFFTIENDYFQIKEKIFNFYIPLILPIIVGWIWVDSRFKILNFVNYHKSVLIYELIVYGTIFGVLMSSNYYLEIVTGELKNIDSINELSGKTPKYLYLSDIDLEFDKAGFHVEFETSGIRYNWNKDLTFTAYIAVPFVVENIEDNAYWIRTEKNHEFWYGIIFSKVIDNKLSINEKEKLYKEFLKQVDLDYKNYDFFKPSYFEILSYSDNLDGYINAIKDSGIKHPNSHVIISPLDNNPNEEANFYLMWIFLSFGIGLILVSFALIFPKINQKPFPPSIFEMYKANRIKR